MLLNLNDVTMKSEIGCPRSQLASRIEDKNGRSTENKNCRGW